jgi:protease-4
MLVHNPNDALIYGLVTDVAYEDQVTDQLKAELGLTTDDKINFVGYKKYKLSLDEEKSKSKNKIAIIVAQGDINSGKSEDGTIGSEDLCAEIRKARLDTTVKAVVLRINSPGGSAMASDVIWREVVLTKARKPVVASMGDVAASGGYYIAMGADKIVARENSITGSIGVFGIIFNIKNLLKNKLGITTDGVKTGYFSDIQSLTKELTEYEKNSIQNEVNSIYESFTSKAAEGRKMKIEDLKKVASGRVWSGLEAKRINLVDTLGGLELAISIAAELANVREDYKPVFYPESKDIIQKFLENLSNQNTDAKFEQILGNQYPLYKEIKSLEKIQGIQARLLDEFSF